MNNGDLFFFCHGVVTPWFTISKVNGDMMALMGYMFWEFD